MPISLTKHQILRALPSVRPGLDKYLWIQRQLSMGPSRIADDDFQRRYNGFYRVRRNAEWRGTFYQLLADNLLTGIEFRDALKLMLDAMSRYEASFVSKLVATINPSKPVIDTWVMKNVGLRLPAARVSNRFSRICDVYSALGAESERFLSTADGSFMVSQFLTCYPDADITETKMLDLILWQRRNA